VRRQKGEGWKKKRERKERREEGKGTPFASLNFP